MATPMTAQHGARGQRRRAQIVRAALEVITERGFRGMSLGAVSEKVGLTQQGLLHYFPTREDLLIAVLQWRDEVDNGGEADGSTPDAIPGPLWTVERLPLLVAVNTQRPELVRLFSVLLGESVTRDHPAGEYFRSRYRLSRQTMAQHLRDVYGQRLPSGLDPDAAATLIVAVFDGLQYQWLHDDQALDMEDLVRQFLRLIDPGWDETASDYV
ncbi:TetR/AcrR family transcriptional regulator [Natronoglycomyces albus]|uniref:TetR/AcrR family transcriptional regulator n=1 Tax=Natronoglycomyces albus TaxID=2811108 RepID=A0A895XPD0_9ACTN|nr:TetR/AcrR family transcriptional regulator [Natronoglycomyces albus]QSB04376.1 TetR/AcrR family transcriptional regulator [Natronoglycomyces albus]